MEIRKTLPNIENDLLEAVAKTMVDEIYSGIIGKEEYKRLKENYELKRKYKLIEEKMKKE